MEINLYEEMNEKIADIMALSDRAVDLYASAYIKALRKEISEIKQQVDNLTIELGQAKAYMEGLEYEKKQAVREFAEKLYDNLIEVDTKDFGRIRVIGEDAVDELVKEVCGE